MSLKFRNFDLFRRVPVDLTEPTAPGAIISVACMVLMLVLFVGEFVSYVAPPTRSDMFVAQDTSSNSRLKVTVDMSFHKLPCFALGFDVLDALGRHEMGVSNTLRKTRLSPADGATEIGDWAEGKHDPAREYPGMKNEGCRVRGYVMVNKVPGNFHVSSHGLESLVMQFLGGTIDVQHTIHELFFGELALHAGKHDYEGEVHPLNGHAQRHNGAFHYEYHLDVVPTIYTRNGNVLLFGFAGGSVERSYQMAVSQHFQEVSPQSHMPAAFFRYQLSPITVKFSKERTSFLHFLTYVCAIVGGIYSVAGVLNRLVYKAVVGFQKGVLGKDS
jgi:hypothetical protein